MFELMVEDSFSAAHQLRGYEGPCEKLHGHTWKVRVFLTGKRTGKLGMVLDFKEIKKALSQALKPLDHGNLNELPRFKRENPTSENVAKLLFLDLKKRIRGARVSKVTVFESPQASASYYD